MPKPSNRYESSKEETHASRLDASRLAAGAGRHGPRPALAPELDTEAFAESLRRIRVYTCCGISGAPVPPSDKPFSVACQAGCLIEVRVGALTSREQIEQMQHELSGLLHGITEAVICVDLRGGRLLPEHLADAGLGAMRADNSLFRACGVLVTSPMLALQMFRLVREAANPGRKIFDTPGELLLWLRPYLTREEFERLIVFVNERTPVGGAELRGVPSNTSS